jgi:hypothetical protein
VPQKAGEKAEADPDAVRLRGRGAHVIDQDWGFYSTGHLVRMTGVASDEYSRPEKGFLALHRLAHGSEMLLVYRSAATLHSYCSQEKKITATVGWLGSDMFMGSCVGGLATGGIGNGKACARREAVTCYYESLLPNA